MKQEAPTSISRSSSPGRAMVWFDEEGSEFTLVMNPYSIFIIEEKEESVLHDIERPAG